MDIGTIATNLKFGDGVWRSRSSREISYPDDGNQECMQIEETSFWFAHRNKCIVEAVKRYFRGEFFVDVGGGNGFTSLALEQAGICSVLLEPGDQGVENARTRGLKNIVCSSMEDAGFQKGVLPAVGLFDVIEHIEDDAAFLAAINGSVATNGLVFITVPAYDAIWSDADVNAGHFRRYTLTRLRSLLDGAGFTPVYCTYFFSALPIPIFFSRSLPNRLGLVRTVRVQKFATDHRQDSGALRFLLNWEVGAIKKGISVPFGGSCLVVASKRA